jgi:HPt (histidine-containing phosphotransfer) domain-containing protein
VREEIRHFGADFRLSQSSDDSETARRLAHTLKGSAGNIGAGDLWAVARTLELACRNNLAPAEIDACLGEVEAELQRVLNVLDAANLDNAGQAAVSDSDP